MTTALNLPPVQQLVWSEILRLTKGGRIDFIGSLRIAGMPQNALWSAARRLEALGLIQFANIDPSNQKAGKRIQVLRETPLTDDDLEEESAPIVRESAGWGIKGFETRWRQVFPDGACYCHGPHAPGFVCPNSARAMSEPQAVQQQGSAAR